MSEADQATDLENLAEALRDAAEVAERYARDGEVSCLERPTVVKLNNRISLEARLGRVRNQLRLLHDRGAIDQGEIAKQGRLLRGKAAKGAP